MKRFELEARATMPPDFAAWFEEVQFVADTAGAWALVGYWMGSPVECCRYLVAMPGVWEALLSRAHYADRRRYECGVVIGRGVGV